MKIFIHRGTNEIGGTCIQLSTTKATILLDIGQPLSPDSKDIDLSGTKVDAVIVSHPHQDHYGLIDTIDKNIPVWIGEVGKNLIDSVRVILEKELPTNNFRYLKDSQAFTVGDIKITPMLVDHSAVDAYSFLIEAEGKRIYYSGDFRAHGRKSVLFDRAVKRPPKEIDVLFMEGTMMQRGNDEFPNEASVEEKIYEVIKNQANISFLISSSQNIDRIVSAYRACKRAGKTLVIDIYTAWVLEQMKQISPHIPKMEWEEVAVYASHNMNEKLKSNPGYFGDFSKRMYSYRIKKEDLQAKPSQYLYLSKMSTFPIIELYKKDKPVNVIYSQWLGYLKNKDYFGSVEMSAYQNDPQVNFVYAHTSGHATVEDLKKFAMALNPKMLVPIHTEHKDKFKEIFNNVIELSDGQTLKVEV